MSHNLSHTKLNRAPMRQLTEEDDVYKKLLGGIRAITATEPRIWWINELAWGGTFSLAHTIILSNELEKFCPNVAV